VNYIAAATAGSQESPAPSNSGIIDSDATWGEDCIKGSEVEVGSYFLRERGQKHF
jgi:hypothetical protein